MVQLLEQQSGKSYWTQDRSRSLKLATRFTVHPSRANKQSRKKPTDQENPDTAAWPFTVKRTLFALLFRIFWKLSSWIRTIVGDTWCGIIASVVCIRTSTLSGDFESSISARGKEVAVFPGSSVAGLHSKEKRRPETTVWNVRFGWPRDDTGMFLRLSHDVS